MVAVAGLGRGGRTTAAGRAGAALGRAGLPGFGGFGLVEEPPPAGPGAGIPHILQPPGMGMSECTQNHDML